MYIGKGWRFRSRLARRLFPLSPKEQLLLDAFHYLHEDKVTGDYYEFGVYEGASMIAAWHLSRAVHWPYFRRMAFNAYDSFNGLPEPTGFDNKGVFYKGKCSSQEDTFTSNLKQGGFDLGQLIIQCGNFKSIESLPNFKGNARAAIVHINSDIYQSAKEALRIVTGTIQNGTVLIFGAWYFNAASPEMGEQRAFHEWLKANPAIKATEFRSAVKQKSFILRKEG